jgi:hypothetical protein
LLRFFSRNLSPFGVIVRAENVGNFPAKSALLHLRDEDRRLCLYEGEAPIIVEEQYGSPTLTYVLWASSHEMSLRG